MLRLEREFQLANDYQMPRLVEAIALEREDEQLVLVMKDAGKQTLAELIGCGPLEISNFFSLAISMAQAVSRLHEATIIHRDLCPQNIVIDAAADSVTLIDLGLATLSHLEPVWADLVRPGRIEGTLPYISPEQTGRMNCAVDFRSDLYALGAIYYEMLTGTVPFVFEDPLKMVHAHLSREPVPPQMVNSRVSAALSKIVLKLLEKSPEDRYQTATGLVHDLICLSQNCEPGRVSTFLPGRRDRPQGLTISEKLYGRETELALLSQDFERVMSEGRTQLLLVSGYSGVGKTAFVRKLYEPLARERGFFLAGKFDQLKRDIPFATLTQAVQELVQYLLTEPEEQIKYWKERLEEEVGAGLALIARVLPKIELLIGKQPVPPELPSNEAKNRFKAVLRQFIKVFAQREHPLVLFLDDLQWADSDALELVKNLVADGDGVHLLIIGAFRDNEMSAEYLLEQLLDGSPVSLLRVRQINIKPLDRKQLNAFVCDTLRCQLKVGEPLTDLIHQRTAGNPLFAIQFLKTLCQERLLQFDQEQDLWTWDLAKLQAQSFADNIVDLLVLKLRKLSSSTRRLLQIAACLGNSGTIAMLSLISEQSNERIAQDLLAAVCDGLIYIGQGNYKFLHDRVQQAAYALIAVEQRPLEHLTIGRTLLPKFRRLKCWRTYLTLSASTIWVQL